MLTAFTEDSADLLRRGFELSHRLLSFPRPVVVAVTGHAYAMGGFLVLSGDHRLGIAGVDYRVTANDVAIGMALPHAATEVVAATSAAVTTTAPLITEAVGPVGSVVTDQRTVGDRA